MNIAEINAFTANTLMAHLGIEYTSWQDKTLMASMPVDSRHHQPFGLLHGGATLAFAESVASMAAQLCLEHGQMAVGLEINANHLKAVRSGTIFAKAAAIHLGKQTQVWQVEVTDKHQQAIAICRMTCLIQSASS